MMKHIWRIKKEYFRQLKTGAKTLEIRVGYAQMKKVQPGDCISFENYGPNEFLVKRIAVYPNFEQMLLAEDVEAVLPGMTFHGALNTLREIYPEAKEAMGVYVFELMPREQTSPQLELVRASDLLREGSTQQFSRLVYDSYRLTDWIARDYPDHCDHFYSKYVPGIFTGEREIVAGFLDGEMVAVAILKKDAEERKISTLYVSPQHQQRGIASKLLRRCFEWLGTTRPLVTIADYKLPQFAGLIQKFGWQETKVLEAGYYNDRSREHVFNGQVEE